MNRSKRVSLNLRQRMDIARILELHPGLNRVDATKKVQEIVSFNVGQSNVVSVGKEIDYKFGPAVVVRSVSSNVTEQRRRDMQSLSRAIILIADELGIQLRSANRGALERLARGAHGNEQFGDAEEDSHG